MIFSLLTTNYRYPILITNRYLTVISQLLPFLLLVRFTKGLSYFRIPILIPMKPLPPLAMHPKVTYLLTYILVLVLF